MIVIPKLHFPGIAESENEQRLRSLPAQRKSAQKSHLVCAMVSVLGACQTPTASNQGTTSSKGTTGTGLASPSSRYDVDILALYCHQILPVNKAAVSEDREP